MVIFKRKIIEKLSLEIIAIIVGISVSSWLNELSQKMIMKLKDKEYLIIF